MQAKLKTLNRQIAGASGPSRDLDALIARTLDGVQAENYTSSVDACLRLIGSVLPGWHWHVGHGPTGILPYAALSRTDPAARIEASAPTVPLALLRAATQAMIMRDP